MLKLYTKINGKFEELSAVALAPHLKPIKKLKVQDAIVQYIKSCTSNKCSKNQNTERLHFERLLKFVNDKDIKHIDEVTCIIMQEYESFILKQMKISSVNRRFNTFKHFFVKCKEWGFINSSPCKGMKKRREENNPHKVWPEKVFRDYIKETSVVYTHIFNFLWLTGCRPMECKNLKWNDINYDQLELTLSCGKNAQVSRKFPITHEISKLLHKIKIDSLYVFSTNKKQISNDLLYQYCKVRLRLIGEESYTVYGLRHTFGTRLANGGANAFVVAELMGHSKIETTRRYVHNNKADLLGILNKSF